MRFVLFALALGGLAACAGPNPGIPDNDSRHYFHAAFYLNGELRDAYFPRQPELHPYGQGE